MKIEGQIDMRNDFAWLRPRAKGLYCAAGDFYIDPIKPVPRAVITHGHADHARAGHGHVIATPETLAIMAVRYGPDHAEQKTPLPYGETLNLDGVGLRFASAGHVLGSAQAVMTVNGATAVVSGDYKRRADPSCAAFEVVPCDLFVTEATFGLPVFRHPDTAGEVGKLIRSLRVFSDRPHLVGVYALGKCQRVIRHLREAGYDAPIYIHGALSELCALYERQGIELGDLVPITAEMKKQLAGQLVLCPPGALADRWSRGFPERITALASGWMRIRQRVRQRRVELPLIISDHADWDELTQTIADTGAGTIWVTHGQEDALVHHATAKGLRAAPLSLQGRDEEAA